MTPLLPRDSRQNELFILFGEIENGFLDINKYYNDLKEYNRKLPNFTMKEYEKRKGDIHSKIHMIPDILFNINQNYDKLTEESFCRYIDDEIQKKLEIIKEKLNIKIIELPNLINQIFEREKIVSLRLKNIRIPESELDDSLSIIHNRSEQFGDSRIIIKEVIENQAYLEKRREELESIKK